MGASQSLTQTQTEDNTFPSYNSADNTTHSAQLRTYATCEFELICAMEEVVMDFVGKLCNSPKDRLAIVLHSPFRSEGCTQVFSLSPARLYYFSRCFKCLAQIHNLLSRSRKATKREMFYEFKKLYGYQRRLDYCVRAICKFFNRPRIALNVLSCSRGFVMGSLQLISPLGGILNCDIAPVAIIEDLCDFAQIFVGAAFILVVESDAIFRRLVTDGIFIELPDVLLVTSCGFPDYSTRSFLRWLMDIKPLPLYCLVDSDPYGLHIYATYRYGSPRSAVEFGNCELPELRLLGLLSGQARKLKLSKSQWFPLDDGDYKRLDHVRQMAKDYGDKEMQKEVNSLGRSRKKIALEALCEKSPMFIITEFLLPMFEKIRCDVTPN